MSPKWYKNNTKSIFLSPRSLKNKGRNLGPVSLKWYKNKYKLKHFGPSGHVGKLASRWSVRAAYSLADRSIIAREHKKVTHPNLQD